MTDSLYIADMTSDEYGALCQDHAPLAVLLPVGSVEPHGPHLSLATDTEISTAASARAVAVLAARGVIARIAPSVGYGVTDCASGFPGAVSVGADVLTNFLAAVCQGYLAGGARHVCLVNNHLEPAHDRAVRAVVERCAGGAVSVACPLSKRWGRLLSDEFKRGECHAGQYETSLMLAAAPAMVRDDARAELPEVPISLSNALRDGISDFKAMGLDRAYAGAPAQATAEEGEALLEVLAEMIATEVSDSLTR